VESEGGEARCLLLFHTCCCDFAGCKEEGCKEEKEEDAGDDDEVALESDLLFFNKRLEEEVCFLEEE